MEQDNGHKEPEQNSKENEVIEKPWKNGTHRFSRRAGDRLKLMEESVDNLVIENRLIKKAIGQIHI